MPKSAEALDGLLEYLRRDEDNDSEEGKKFLLEVLRRTMLFGQTLAAHCVHRRNDALAHFRACIVHLFPIRGRLDL